MFIYFGTLKRHSDPGVTLPEIGVLKRRITIAVLDDEPFIKLEALRAHDFQLTELGGDIKSIYRKRQQRSYI